MVACDICASRKVRCCGKQPCFRCVKDQKECTYDRPRQRYPKRSSSPSSDNIVDVRALHLISSPRKNALFVSPEFVHYYFSHLYAHMPVLHNASMENREYVGSLPEFWIASFNAFVAHFAARDDSYPFAPRPSLSYATSLRKQAKKLLKDCKDASIELVQAFGFLSRVLIAAGELIAGWRYSGSMMRLATLLQINWESRDYLTDVEVEVARRTWWACFITDRTSSGGGRVPYAFDFGNSDRPLPVPENTFHSPNFSYSDFLSEQNGQIVGEIGFFVQVFNVFGEIVLLTMEFSRRFSPVTHADREELPVPVSENESTLLKCRWQKLYSDLKSVYTTYNKYVQNDAELFRVLGANDALSTRFALQFHIFTLYHYAIIMLHIPSHMTVQFPHPIIPWADHQQKEWVESARLLSLLARATLKQPRTPTWIPSYFECILYTSSCIHLLELITFNEKLIHLYSTTTIPSEAQQMNLLQEKENLVSMLDTNYRTMFSVSTIWQVNDGFRKLVATKMKQLGLAVPNLTHNIEKGQSDA